MLIPPEGGGVLLEKYSGNVRNQKFKVVSACMRVYVCKFAERSSCRVSRWQHGVVHIVVL